MLKTKYKVGLGLLVTAASALTGCGLGGGESKDNVKKSEDGAPVVFWSSFGSTYSSALTQVINGVKESTGVEIDHKPQGSYDEINKNMISAIAVGDYPNLAIGYPDHFATYLGSDVLEPLDSHFSAEEFNDYYAEYMEENKFYDNGKQNAKERIYGVPFNKSTELLGYNGVFVDYCASLPGKSHLAKIPTTWAEWGTKGAEYNEIFKSLFGKCVYGVQDVYGTASNFLVTDPKNSSGDPFGETDENGNIVYEGRTLLLNMAKVNASNAVLMSWDATDNAFITLTRQWGAEYTVVPEEQKYNIAKKRVGNAMFNSSENQGKVIDMLKTFRKFKRDGLFGTPNILGGSYSSAAFEICRVMFMICSSGGLSYNTADWHHRFRVAPILTKDSSHKYVISQGANLCLTNKGNYDYSVKVMKALTTGKYQTEWCLKTGYYPCSKSATNSTEYQAFLKEAETKPAEEAYASPVRVAYREGSKLNSDEYMSASKGWVKFVDPAFAASSILRGVVKGVLDSAFAIADADIENDAKYKAVLDSIENSPDVLGKPINFVH